MKKNIGIAVVLTFTALCLLGCSTSSKNTNESSNQSITENKNSENTTNDIEQKNTAGTETAKTDNEMLSSENASKEPKYFSALTEQDINQTEQLAKDYYMNEFAYDLLSIEIADDTSSAYQEFAAQYNYEPGNIVIFYTDTTHAPGIRRLIVYGRNNKDEDWKMVTEGY